MTLTGRDGEPLPQPGDGAWLRAMPTRAVLFLMYELMGTETEGEGLSGSAA